MERHNSRSWLTSSPPPTSSCMFRPGVVVPRRRAPPKEEGLVKMVLVVLRHFHRQNFSKDKRREFWRLALSGAQKRNRGSSSFGPFPRQQLTRRAQKRKDRLGKSSQLGWCLIRVAEKLALFVNYSTKLKVYFVF